MTRHKKTARKSNPPVKLEGTNLLIHPKYNDQTADCVLISSDGYIFFVASHFVLSARIEFVDSQIEHSSIIYFFLDLATGTDETKSYDDPYEISNLLEFCRKWIVSNTIRQAALGKLLAFEDLGDMVFAFVLALKHDAKDLAMKLLPQLEKCTWSSDQDGGIVIDKHVLDPIYMPPGYFQCLPRLYVWCLGRAAREWMEDGGSFKDMLEDAILIWNEQKPGRYPNYYPDLVVNDEDA
ncbi:hypothetical protein BD324DRAFT_650673 [Kockovaella imperatae]|uniref:BTB domain-containing protein n=1 Tax=Kockovaella imperatae TaxID=4999 RepID=A0A1Y1UG67_9TREE|nr:hypothetical protein BD324DRAFT_650673 [Kockovaella imperatae]ORX37060.1 hypothetical protein BD324DRAFT_650673 [Kockovaella imperatae]